MRLYKTVAMCADAAANKAEKVLETFQHAAHTLHDLHSCFIF